jgi:glycosyltransferase involved in cell wall biosynthesis/peptidoglycan/xylan/chitin deacetylase (PgdA/CDA1 family)
MPVVVNFTNLSPMKLDVAQDIQLALAKKLRECGCTPIWLVFSSRFDHIFKKSEEDGLRVEIIPTKDTEGIRLIVFLLKFILREKVDIMSMHFIRPWNAIILIFFAKVLFSKTIFIYNKRSPGRLLFNKFNLKKYINPLSILSWFVDKVICNSDAINANCLNRGVSQSKLVRIYNGLCIKRFEKIFDKEKIRKEFGISPDYQIVTAIKQAIPGMGLDDLISSIPAVLAVYPKTMFLIVGGGEETAKLKELVHKLRIEGNVIFTGIRNDVPDIIAESFFTVDPCPIEAFGYVIVESMAGKKPVIGVNAWGPKEIIINGETGILVEPQKPYTDFAPAINELLSSPQRVKKMGEKCLARVKERFSLESMSENTVELYKTLLKTPLKEQLQEINQWREENSSIWKSCVDKFIFSSGVLNVFRMLIKDKAVILMYHRVPPKTISQNGFCTDLFEAQIRYLKKFYNIISLKDLVEYSESNQFFPENSVVITFDDGYVDNYLYAYPILKKHNVPATIFLIADFIENKRMSPMDRIEYIITKSRERYLELRFDEYKSSINDEVWQIKLENNRKLLARKVVDVALEMSPADIWALIDYLSMYLKVEVPSVVNEERYSPLTWDQIREMSECGITFGSHTYRHLILTKLTPDEKYSELADSKRLIEERLGKKVDYFAYPYGGFNETDKSVLKRLDFKAAISTLEGFNKSNSDLFELKRYSGEYSLAKFARRVSGFNVFKNKK